MNKRQQEQETDGYQIARRLIAEEAEHKTGFLDLGRLGLTELPEELFQLTHLTGLNLGNFYFHGEVWKPSKHQLGWNVLGTSLKRLAELKLEVLHVSGTDVEDLQPLSKLASLQRVECVRTNVSDLRPLINLRALRSLNCSETQVKDLQPLTELCALQHLNCSRTQVSDLAPLAKLQLLQSLNFSEAKVRSLEQLADLQALKKVYCWNSHITDLNPLTNLKSLQELHCADTQVSDLKPLTNLQTLQTLYCSCTRVSDLRPLANLPLLETLYCSKSQVAELGPLADVQSLQSLGCSNTLVSDLRPLAKLASLRSLFCMHTRVKDLKPLRNLATLKKFSAFGCTIESLDTNWIQQSRLDWLCLGPKVADIPDELLSPDVQTSCLESLRSHLRNMKDGSELSRDVKLLLIGNGRVGKSQIARRLKGLEPEAEPDSTHGVVVLSTRLPLEGGEAATPINLWDFGGQDVYHGTHALFMKCQGLFVVVWSSDAENSREHEYRGMTFRNYPVPYWLTYVCYLGGADSPVIVVQNKCESASAEANSPPCSPADLQAFESFRAIHYSAHLDRGRPSLNDALAAAIEHLHATHRVARVGKGRMAVRRELERLRDEDSPLEPAARQHRTITQAAFRQMCETAGSISSPEAFLRYLHNCGTVFYQEGLFDEQIILDQSWALDAIYAVLDRKKSLGQIRQLRGRFTRSLLDALVWSEFSAVEQQLFLSMMQSCGICFVHREANERLEIEAEYIAPDLLPERESLDGEIAALWEHDAPHGELVFAYPFLHHALLRGLISEIGQLAQGTGVYWRYGLCGYEATTACHLLIDHQREGDLAGRVIVACKGHRHGELLGRIRQLIEHQNSRYGVNEVEVTGDVPAAEGRMPGWRDGREGGSQPGRDLQFAPSPVKQDVDEYYISYAWGDDSPAGQQRAQAVDDLCEQARERGVEILIDKEQIKVGERISVFMRRIGRGKRVFVILSDKYLKSPFCMFELFEIWRTSEEEPEKFLNRVRVFQLPDANISKLKDRLVYTKYWLEEFAETQAMVDQVGAVNLSGPSLQQWRAMRDFAEKTDIILTHLADVLKPTSINDLAEAVFDES